MAGLAWGEGCEWLAFWGGLVRSLGLRQQVFLVDGKRI